MRYGRPIGSVAARTPSSARRTLAARFLTTPARAAVVGLIAVGLEVLINVPLGDWHDRYPVLPTALGLLVAVLAGVFGGVIPGVLAAAVGAALNAIYVTEGNDGLLALPAWLIAGGVAGWAGASLYRAARDRDLAAGELDGIRQTAGDAIVGVDREGVITDWSAGAHALYGYDGDDVVGTPLVDLFDEADRSTWEEQIRGATEQGEPIEDAHATHRTRAGEPLSVALSLVPTAADQAQQNGAVLVARDVGALEALQEQTREAESMYRALTEHLPVVTYVRPIDADAPPIFVSAQLDRLVGYTPEEWLRDARLFGRILHPEDRNRVVSELAKPPSPSRPKHTEYRLLARDGRVVWVRDEAVAVLDGHGRPLCIQGYLLDVTERKLADEDRKQLRAAEATATAGVIDRQRTVDFLARAAGVLASSVDYRATITEVSELAASELADWCIVDRLEEDGNVTRVVAARAEPSVAGSEEEPEADVLGIVKQQGPQLTSSRIEVPLVSHGRRTLGALTLISGEHRRAFTSHDLGWAGALAGMIALAIDTARMHDEVEARAEATRVLTYVGDGVFLVDRAGVIRLWNPMAEAITGLSSESVLGRAAIEAIPGWDQLSERIPIAAVGTAAGTEAVPIETDRGERWISISGVEFFAGTVYAFRDITEAHRLDELQAEFIATASHELRTPLAAVYGAAQTLRRHDFALDESGRARFISLIVDESERLGRIVNQILLANQLDVGRLDLVTEPFDAAELLERVTEAARTHAPAHITLAVGGGDATPPVAADKDRVRQILVNLVENAIKYSPDGGTIELGVEPTDESMVLFRVLDEGMGIPDDEQPRIFQKFYRLDPDMTRGIGGTGLGLYICSELVERMGGRIWVESRETSGSAFYFELPSAGLRPAKARETFGADRTGR
jgi:PAS domain S-box-containing protein